MRAMGTDFVELADEEVFVIASQVAKWAPFLPLATCSA